MDETPKKILIVDDEPDMLDFLSTFLQDNGFEVILAANGKECFEKAKKEILIERGVKDRLCLLVSDEYLCQKALDSSNMSPPRSRRGGMEVTTTPSR